MAIINTSKPSNTLTNVSRVSYAETWATITTTWASETRSWDDLNFIDNISRQVASLTNIAKPS